MSTVTPSTHQKQLEFDDNQFLVSLFGSHDKNLKALEGKFQVKLYNRGNFLSIKGKRDPVEKAYFIIEGLYKRLKNKDISQNKFTTQIKSSHTQGSPYVAHVYFHNILSMNN